MLDIFIFAFLICILAILLHIIILGKIICYYSGCQSKKSSRYFMNFISCGISIRCCKTMLKNICKHHVIPGAGSGKDQLSFESFFSDPAHILAALDFSISFKWIYWHPLPPSSTSPRAQCGELSGHAPYKQTRHWVWLETSSLTLISPPFSLGFLFPRQRRAIHTVSLCYRNRPDNIVSEQQKN